MSFLVSLLAALVLISCSSPDPYSGWGHYKGGPESIHYSSLKEVDTGNVHLLQPAWTYRTGDADTVHHSQIQCNPIIIDGILYGTSPAMKLFAVDAATGKERWSFNPFDSLSGDKGMFYILNNSRGLATWSDGEERRLYYTAGPHLYCIDAATGRPVPGFGSGGRIDLHEGLDRDVRDLFITATSPPIVFEDLLIAGSRVDEGPAAAPGHIRAFDVRTGKRRWIFHTVPHPGEEGHSTWKDTSAYRFIGGANAWSGFSLDRERGLLFAVTGSASYDWYGGRRLGDNLFANSLLALNVRTGERRWHFQAVHHDVWDRDLSSPPALVTVARDGGTVPAVALTTKSGYVYLFEREGGKPLFPIEERPVPRGTDLRGEELSPTQPYPVKPAPFVRQLFTERDINPFLSAAEAAEVRRRLAGYKKDHMYHPPSLQGTVVLPGLDGGAEWGGPAWDPETGVLYINANEMAWVIQAVEVKEETTAAETMAAAGQRLYGRHCMSCHGTDRQGSGNFPALRGLGGRYEPAAVTALLQSGRRMMPAFAHLNDEEREALAAFVLERKEAARTPFMGKASDRDDPTRLPYTITGYNRFLTATGKPALAPPWGSLHALHLSSGNYLWHRPLGVDTALGAAGIEAGTENYGAPVVTAGGLLFIAATRDRKFRAFSKRTGRLLWEAELPAAGFATPAVYAAGGRQYIVIACGGGKMGTPSADAYVAFALPAGD